MEVLSEEINESEDIYKTDRELADIPNDKIKELLRKKKNPFMEHKDSIRSARREIENISDCYKLLLIKMNLRLDENQLTGVNVLIEKARLQEEKLKFCAKSVDLEAENRGIARVDSDKVEMQNLTIPFFNNQLEHNSIYEYKEDILDYLKKAHIPTIYWGNCALQNAKQKGHEGTAEYNSILDNLMAGLPVNPSFEEVMKRLINRFGNTISIMTQIQKMHEKIGRIPETSLGKKYNLALTAVTSHRKLIRQCERIGKVEHIGSQSMQHNLNYILLLQKMLPERERMEISQTNIPEQAFEKAKKLYSSLEEKMLLWAVQTSDDTD